MFFTLSLSFSLSLLRLLPSPNKKKLFIFFPRPSAPRSIFFFYRERISFDLILSLRILYRGQSQSLENTRRFSLRGNESIQHCSLRRRDRATEGSFSSSTGDDGSLLINLAELDDCANIEFRGCLCRLAPRSPPSLCLFNASIAMSRFR